MGTTTSAETAGSVHDLPPIVLLVEEDRELLKRTSRMCDDAGFWTATATNPREALLAVQELKPDVVVTDLVFGGEDTGSALVHELKSASARAGTPVIVLSDLGSNDLPAATRAEADVVLVKPFTIDELLQRIRAALEASHRLRARGTVAVERGQQLRARSDRLRAQSAAAA